MNKTKEYIINYLKNEYGIKVPVDASSTDDVSIGDETLKQGDVNLINHMLSSQFKLDINELGAKIDDYIFTYHHGTGVDVANYLYNLGVPDANDTRRYYASFMQDIVNNADSSYAK